MGKFSSKESGACEGCNTKILFKKREGRSGYFHRRYCDRCLSSKRNKTTVDKMTKVELFKKRKTWISARSAIAKNARRVFLNSDKPKCCEKCGYDKHYEVAHINSVSSFDDDVLISEINDIDNLVALCPNHHWEYDNGLMIL